MQPDAPRSEMPTPIACTLTPKRIPGQVAEWGDLVAQADQVVRIMAVFASLLRLRSLPEHSN